MAAPTLVLDPSGLNINLNAQASATGVKLKAAYWGDAEIQAALDSGAYRLEDIDGLWAAGGVTRQVVLTVRIVGSSKDNLNLQISNLNYAFALASRYQPLDLVFTPGGSTKTSTFKVLGGSVQAPPYGQTEDLQNKELETTVTVTTLPAVYGVTQFYGSTGSPLFATAAGPGAFIVTIPSGSEGDFPADVTVIFQLTADPAGTVTLACLSGNTGWNTTDDVTAWTAGSGGGTRAAQSNAKYKGGAAPGYKVLAQNTVEEAFTNTYTTTDFPAGTAIRCLLLADDFQVVAAQRGLYQLRLVASCGGVTQTGDWVSVPASAGNGTTTHFMQGLDMGVFTFPPGPTGTQPYTGTTKLAIQVQDANTAGNKLTCAFDSILFLPDATSLISEWPVTQPGATVTLRAENDQIYSQGTGAPWTVATTGAHIRSRGTTRYAIWASTQPLANNTGDVSYSLVKAWIEYTPRFVGLASA